MTFQSFVKHCRANIDVLMTAMSFDILIVLILIKSSSFGERTF